MILKGKVSGGVEQGLQTPRRGDGADGRVNFQRQELQLAWYLPEVLEVGARMQGC